MANVMGSMNPTMSAYGIALSLNQTAECPTAANRPKSPNLDQDEGPKRGFYTEELGEPHAKAQPLNTEVRVADTAPRPQKAQPDRGLLAKISRAMEESGCGSRMAACAGVGDLDDRWVGLHVMRQKSMHRHLQPCGTELGCHGKKHRCFAERKEEGRFAGTRQGALPIG